MDAETASARVLLDTWREQGADRPGPDGLALAHEEQRIEPEPPFHEGPQA